MYTSQREEVEVDGNLLEALAAIPVGSTTYEEWVQVGMALHVEGYPMSVWDEWSAGDARYHSGECSKKWRGFGKTNTSQVAAGTLVDIAKRFGYTPGREIKTFDWDDEISYDGDPDALIKDTAWLDTSAVIEAPKDSDFNGPDQLRRYLQNLFKKDEIVGFCIDAEKDENDGKWKPSTKGAYGFTAGQLLERIKKHPDDIGAVIGDYNKDAGVWIRFNPLNGAGVANANVTDLRYALVESDNMTMEKQKALMEELRLPIAIMVNSGGKSIHAIVKVNADRKSVV